jgi:hypothetical protein
VQEEKEEEKQIDVGKGRNTLKGVRLFAAMARMRCTTVQFTLSFGCMACIRIDIS